MCIIHLQTSCRFKLKKVKEKVRLNAKKITIKHGYSEHAYIEQTQQSDFHFS